MISKISFNILLHVNLKVFFSFQKEDISEKSSYSKNNEKIEQTSGIY